jgi:hypothetical protein
MIETDYDSIPGHFVLEQGSTYSDPLPTPEWADFCDSVETRAAQRRQVVDHYEDVTKAVRRKALNEALDRAHKKQRYRRGI